ncbi:zinc-ribbon domain-containing protein [Roseobacter weihaiensis]|uniref:zinc-ribbon domain-containing protein n=1 Tax=Roseobacter weihaiensis TaxID=2763262 RepID=UPI001D0BB633|nr:zinc-ribbon domain-containing protein [Roseobacter sp. H9]
MRLICPNCDAQYEVPDGVMPRDGRDVQCSNCGQTWFQKHPDAASEREEDAEPLAKAEEESLASEPEGDAKVEPETKAETEAGAETPPSPETPEPAPPARRELDPTVAEVLRTEAELEAQARKNETTGVESQPDLGLTEAPEPAGKRPVPNKPKAPEGQKDDATSVAVASVMPKGGDLLPDIEEINSTLRSNNDRAPGADAGQTGQIEVQEKRSSRRGFILTIALVVILVMIYIYAPQLAQAVPQAEPMLSGYVSMIDGWRVWLDAQVSSALSWLDAAANSSSQ